MPDRERKRVPDVRSGLLKGLVVAPRVLLTVLGTWKIRVSEAELKRTKGRAEMKTQRPAEGIVALFPLRSACPWSVLFFLVLFSF